MQQPANAKPPQGGQWSQRYSGRPSGATNQDQGSPAAVPTGRSGSPGQPDLELARRTAYEQQRAEALALWEADQRRKRIRRDAVTAIVALVLLCQVAGTMGWTSWSPGLLLHGGLERVIDYAIGRGIAVAVWVKVALDGLIGVYWFVLLLACSRLGKDEPPGINPSHERRWVLTQRRVAYAWALCGLLACHALGTVIAAHGWWPLAIPFEFGGHLGMAALLYLFLVPEARRSVVIVEDFGGKGFDNRLHITLGPLGRGRRWGAVRHDHLREAAMHSPLWARLCGVAHIEFTYLDTRNVRQVDTVHAIGSAKEVSQIVATLNGEFRDGRALVFTLPPSYANTPQPPQQQP